jgi:hypothetical protein
MSNFSRRFLPLAGGVVAAVLLAAPPAFAAVRYASPTGSGPEPCNPVPCSLPSAVNNASDSDRVIVAPGHYELGPGIVLDHSIDVGPEPGAAVPTIGLSFENVRVENAGAVLHDLRIEMAGPAMTRALILEGGTVERVYATGGELTGGACDMSAGLLRDSVCWGGLGGLSVFAGDPGSIHADLRNVTASTTFVGASGGGNLTVDAVNLIAHGAGLNGDDLYIDVNTGSSASIVLSHSNYATVNTSLSAGTEFSFTPPGTNGNQTAEPLFVDAAAGDVRQAAGSPTIDAGVSDPLIGDADLDGNPRSQPPCIGGSPIPDIGAYEATPTVACPKPSNLFRFGKLKRNKKKGTAKLAVKLPGPGTLSLRGKGVVSQPRGGTPAKPAVRTISRAGTVKLLIKAKGKRKRKLNGAGKVKVKLRVTYTPTGGDPNTRVKKAKLIKRR